MSPLTTQGNVILDFLLYRFFKIIQKTVFIFRAVFWHSRVTVQYLATPGTL